ncbi:peptidoglycan recognition protein [Holotrichia oblita]|uniref:Peptidoglycan recognition protein n=1 Tax=Holotrichia oblita TaxID=644536 RepID=A0ACB9TZC4_HOLOL|nr:peptidoglycan recognition protein [Holotrichia oblita]
MSPRLTSLREDQVELLFQSSVNTYRNITIKKSKNVHLGNVTYINGPVYINQTANIINNQTIINKLSNNDEIRPPRIVPRRNWLAEPPRSPYEEMTKPAKFVIISHSASEDATTEFDNVLLVRLIQQFHVESRKWDDIAYSFLVGCDGNVYEGRGWTAVGAHTYSFNKYAIGISFIGCFVNKLPPKMALLNAKQLIAYGVKIGAIDENYQLLAHSQCSATASPGEKLIEEIKTWKNWASEVSIDNPPIEILNDKNLG